MKAPAANLLGAGMLLLSACASAPVEPPKPPVVTEVADQVEAATTPPKITKTAAADLKWEPGPGGKFQMAVPFKDEQTGSMVLFGKFPAGWKSDWHYHPTGFSRVLLEGDFVVTAADGTKMEAKPGDYVRAGANGVHTGETKGGALMLIISDTSFGMVATDQSGKPTDESAPAPGDASEGVAVTAAADLPWMEVPGGNGLQMATVYTNPETKGIAAFVKFPAGAAMPPHYHPTNYHRVVLDGQLDVTSATGEAMQGQKGDYFRSEGNLVHSAMSATGGLIFVVTEGPWGTVLVDEAGSPLAQH